MLKYDVVFYEDSKGHKSVETWFNDLYARTQQGHKPSRVLFNAISNGLKVLRMHGTYIGKPLVKNVGHGVWRLQAHKSRIFFGICGNNFVLLHYVPHKSQNKMNLRDISLAEKRMADWITRHKEC